jgi:hypothetical protein
MMKTESLIKMYLDMLRKGVLPKDPNKADEDQKLMIRAGILKKWWFKKDMNKDITF